LKHAVLAIIELKRAYYTVFQGKLIAKQAKTRGSTDK
jgi:hypothetical protein